MRQRRLAANPDSRDVDDDDRVRPKAHDAFRRRSLPLLALRVADDEGERARSQPRVSASRVPRGLWRLGRCRPRRAARARSSFDGAGSEAERDLPLHDEEEDHDGDRGQGRPCHQAAPVDVSADSGSEERARLGELATEAWNADGLDLDMRSTRELVALMSSEDARVPAAVAAIVSLPSKTDAATARERLAAADGVIRRALDR